MLKSLKHWLRHSSHVHIRQGEVASLSELVLLLDRFLDNCTRYPLEWNDFVSWKSRVPAIEQIRQVVAATEPLFFSGSPKKQAEGTAIVLEQRNRAAAFVGWPPRDHDSLENP